MKHPFVFAAIILLVLGFIMVALNIAGNWLSAASDFFNLAAPLAIVACSWVSYKVITKAYEKLK